MFLSFWLECEYSSRWLENAATDRCAMAYDQLQEMPGTYIPASNTQKDHSVFSNSDENVESIWHGADITYFVAFVYDPSRSSLGHIFSNAKT